MPIDAPKFSTATRRQRLFTAFFLTAVAIAMLSWLTGIGWAMVSLVRLVL
jgi:hypothetical protein